MGNGVSVATTTATAAVVGTGVKVAGSAELTVGVAGTMVAVALTVVVGGIAVVSLVPQPTVSKAMSKRNPKVTHLGS
jgi:hypothetical protein